MKYHHKALLLAAFDTLTFPRVWLAYFHIFHRRTIVQRLLRATIVTPSALASAWRYAIKVNQQAREDDR